MRKVALFGFSRLLLVGCSNSDSSLPLFSSLPKGVTLVEEVKAEPGKVSILYSKYRLDNGLTVILSPDDLIPWCMFF